MLDGLKFVEFYEKELQREIEITKAAITSGGIDNFADYKYETGILAGLTKCLDALKATERTLYEDSEEDM